jgi:cytoskeletal protein RodZ
MGQVGSFGEQLRRAREARHLSLKEVEGAIKIREDFLQEFENGNWDFSLPDIYKRGFLRTYAEFLELDVEKLLAKIPATADKGQTESAVDLPIGETSQPVAATGESNWASAKKYLLALCKNWRWQLGGAIFAVGLLLFFLLRSPSPTDAEWADLLRSEESEVVSSVPAVAKKMTIIASDNVQVLVRTKDSKKKIFSAFLKKGAAEVIEYAEPLQVSFSEGGALSVRTDAGETLRPKKPGVGWMEIAY